MFIFLILKFHQAEMFFISLTESTEHRQLTPLDITSLASLKPCRSARTRRAALCFHQTLQLLFTGKCLHMEITVCLLSRLNLKDCWAGQRIVMSLRRESGSNRNIKAVYCRKTQNHRFDLNNLEDFHVNKYVKKKKV